MINKIRNMAGKIIVLALVMTMVVMVPTGVFADVDMWKDYKEKVTTGILNQQGKITITFNGSKSFDTEYFARLTIDSEYEKVKAKMSNIYSDLNVESETTSVVLNEKLQLESVTHMLTYKNDNKDFVDIKTILVDKYKTIKTIVTDYDKIKAAYDYVIAELQKPVDGRNISGILSSQGNNSHAVLFSMMMTELGYDNDIASTTDVGKAKWNLVKVQGQWYHVDATVINNFLTVNKGSDWNVEKHDGKSFATKDYDGNPSTLPQIRYEIKLMNDEIDKTVAVVGGLSEEISIEKIGETKKKFTDIEEKFKSYEERKEILITEGKRLGLDQLDSADPDFPDLDFPALNVKITVLSKAIENKKISIYKKAVKEAELTFELVDIAAAKEAITMVDDSTAKEKMNALEIAIIAIERAKSTKAGPDITLAKEAVKNDKIKDLQTRLEERIKILETTIAVEKAENTKANDDIEKAQGLVTELKDEDAKTGLQDRIDAIKAEINSNKEEQERINEAKIAVDAAEKDLKDNEEIAVIKVKIEKAEKAIELVKTDSVKKLLQDRINHIEIAITAIKSVNDAELKIKNVIDTDLLANIIQSAEAAVKIAETKVKIIKDSGVRTAQQNRIKDIKLVITAIKAVDKAETVKPASATNVKSARTAIAKVSEDYQTGTIENLNNRIEKLDEAIKAVEAESLTEKAEKSFKRADYKKAREAVDKLKKAEPIPPTDTPIDQSEKYKKLDGRLVDCNVVITAIEAVEKAEALMKANKEEEYNKYGTTVGEARTAYNTANKKNDVGTVYNTKYGERLTNLNNRIADMETAITAIKGVIDAEVKYKAYQEDKSEEKKVALEEAINGNIGSKPPTVGAKQLTSYINDKNANLINIKKSLQSRLKEITDALDANGAYNIVNDLLKEIEEKEKVEDKYGKLIKELSKEDKELDVAIELLETKIARIVKDTQDIKVSSKNKELKDRTTAINDVIAATKAVVKAEEKDQKTISKDIATANKAVEKLRTTGIYKNISGLGEFKTSLEVRIKNLEDDIAASTNEKNARELVDKAIKSKKEADIKAAIDAVDKVANETGKTELNEKIEGIVDQIIVDAKAAISTILTSIRRNDKLVSKNITEAKKAVLLADKVVLLKEEYKDKYKDAIENLNKNIDAIDMLMNALKFVEQADKTKTQKDVEAAKTALVDFEGVYRNLENVSKGDNDVYVHMIADIDKRIKAIEAHIQGETDNETAAEKAVKAAEDVMKVKTNPSSAELRDAQDSVNKVTDKTKKAELQKRIDAMNIAIAAKTAVDRAEAYIDAAGVKAAEKALDNLVKTGSYLDIVKDLSMRIGNLNKELNISKLVAEAANLVQKAVESRKQNDITIARDAVEGIKEFVNLSDPNNPYASLIARLVALEESIEKEATGESTALKTAQDELLKATKEIEAVSTDIAKIIAGGVTEKDDIQNAYAKIQVAKNNIIASNAAIRRLIDKKQQTDLLKEIDFINKEIDLAEDNIDVKEAVRLVTIASSSVMNATNEGGKSEARLDIAAARRAIDRIGHINNKALKTTILNTINSIEKKLTSDNDQELINLAVEEVNKAAELLAKAVRENKVMDPIRQEEIDKAIFAAKMAIGWISDNNKSAKDTLTGFINDIATMFEAEKLGILNEDRIKNAEKAVAEAESKKGSDQLESYIRSARLRIKMIQKDGKAETEVIINELNTRLDVLEGKGSGGSGTDGSGGNKPGGGSNKPDGGGTTPGNKVPTKPLSDKDRVIGTTDPIWGKTNELKKKNPITGLPTYDATAYRVKESIKEITEVSNILRTLPNANAKLVVGGKNISLGSKSYIHDKVNNSILVPIKFLGDELGFSVSLIDSPVTKGAKRILINGIVDGKTKSISMDLGSEYYYVNGNLIKASSKSLIEGGRTYIPVDLMVEHFGLTFSYSKSGNNIQLIIN